MLCLFYVRRVSKSIGESIFKFTFSIYSSLIDLFMIEFEVYARKRKKWSVDAYVLVLIVDRSLFWRVWMGVVTQLYYVILSLTAAALSPGQIVTV